MRDQRIVTWPNGNAVISFCGTWVTVAKFFAIASRDFNARRRVFRIIALSKRMRHVGTRRPRWLTRPTFSPPYTAEETSLVLRDSEVSPRENSLSYFWYRAMSKGAPRGPAETPCFLNGRKSLAAEFAKYAYRPWFKFSSQLKYLPSRKVLDSIVWVILIVSSHRALRGYSRFQYHFLLFFRNFIFEKI